jgi:sugar lactone lactonase YvrE
MNDGNPPPQGAVAGAYDWISGEASGLIHGGARDSFYTQDNHAVSADGSLYFTAAKTGQLYLRENPAKEQSAVVTNPNGEEECTEAAKACTIHISASEKTNGHGEGGADAAGARPAAFMAASKDGSKALFISSEKLTDDANTGPEPINSPAIARANVNSGGEKEIEFLPAHADGIAVSGEYIYWADPDAHAIGRAKLNGAGDATEMKPEFIPGAGTPNYVAVNAEHIYWSNAGDGQKGTGTIARAKLDGSEAELVFITGATNPQGVAVDAAHIYWINDGKGGNCFKPEELPECIPTTKTIGRAGIEGDEVDQYFGDLSTTRVQGLAVNATHIFSAGDYNDGTGEGFVLKLDLEGNFVGVLYEEDGQPQPANLRGIAIDDAHVYWGRQAGDAIGRHKVNFSDNHLPEEFEFVKSAGHPLGLAVDSEHIYWAANQEILPNRGNDLYRYDTEAPVGERLTDLTPDPSEENGAEVLGVLGASADASYVYFAANGDLDGPSGPASAGDCHGSASVFVIFSGECSLYLAHAGQLSFIARLKAESDATDWLPRGTGIDGEKTARASADGQTLLFVSKRKLTSYDNEGASELYRYRAGAGLLCVSCNPTGEGPSGKAGLGFITFPALRAADPAFTLSRNLSADGNRVFFESTEALLPADTNGAAGCPLSAGQNSNAAVPVCKDVYEWEAKGTGSCESQAQNGGCLYLLSSGKSDQPSYFLDASASGEDAFLITRSAFARQDGDQLFDVYDARVSGGLASQNQPPPPLCEAEGCKSEPSAPPQGRSPGSASFSGPGNPKPHKPKPRCGKGRRAARAKSKSRCTARHHKRETKSNREQSR